VSRRQPKLFVWDAQSGTQIIARPLDEAPSTQLFHSGDKLLWGTVGDTVYSLDVTTWKIEVILNLRESGVRYGKLCAVAVTTSGVLLTGHADGSVLQWTHGRQGVPTLTSRVKLGRLLRVNTEVKSLSLIDSERSLICGFFGEAFRITLDAKAAISPIPLMGRIRVGAKGDLVVGRASNPMFSKDEEESDRSYCFVP
jgi:hypothetical protein